MKKTLITLLALAGVATAGEVFNLSTAGAPDKGDAVVSNGTITPSASNWETFDYAKYALDEAITLSAPADTLDFSFTVNRPHAIHGSDTVEKSLTTLTFALTGGGQAIIVGHNNETSYEASAAELQVGTSSSIGDYGYIFRSGNKDECIGVSASKSLNGGMPFDTSTITGQIAWNTTNSVFTLTLTSSAWTNNEALQFDLGESVTVDNIVFSVNGVDTPSFTAASVSANLVPEPTTATLSLLALAGLAARRRRK